MKWTRPRHPGPPISASHTPQSEAKPLCCVAATWPLFFMLMAKHFALSLRAFGLLFVESHAPQISVSVSLCMRVCIIVSRLPTCSPPPSDWQSPPGSALSSATHPHPLYGRFLLFIRAFCLSCRTLLLRLALKITFWPILPEPPAQWQWQTQWQLTPPPAPGRGSSSVDVCSLFSALFNPLHRTTTKLHCC